MSSSAPQSFQLALEPHADRELSCVGEPCFDKLVRPNPSSPHIFRNMHTDAVQIAQEACLAQAMLSIPATKGFEIGSGFAGTMVPGSLHNDAFIAAPAIPPSQTGLETASKLSNGHSTDGDLSKAQSKEEPLLLKTKTNNSGGVQGGISNGAPIYFKVAFKPPATIGQAQQTVRFSGEEGVLEAKGRHDPCVVPRAVPIVEAMAALVIYDALMAQDARTASRMRLPGQGERERADVDDGTKDEDEGL